MIETRNISVNYGGRSVLRDLSFELKSGEIMALLGSNGTGKTTLIRALNGLIPLSSGEVRLDAKRLADHSRREIAQRVGVVTQENETKFPVTVLEFVLAGRFAHGRAFGWESGEDIAHAQESLAVCDLADYSSRLMNELSGGERQRVVLARALATNAEVLLLDEPTANLDLAHQALMFRLVRQRCHEHGASAIVITHDLNLAAEFGDEIMLLKDGGVFAKGKPVDVLTTENIDAVYGVNVLLDENPATSKVRVTMVY
ncbi:MAG TPA: ABC transporter ATP-binding protein [Pyrinomonadaceae bacterium]|nr:ABC transporter ATP-binding protein [Pyrinomonadaceae bacterium]